VLIYQRFSWVQPKDNITGWWFGTWMIFFHINWECHHPNCYSLHHFSRWLSHHQPDKITAWFFYVMLSDLSTWGGKSSSNVAGRCSSKMQLSWGSQSSTKDVQWSTLITRGLGQSGLNMTWILFWDHYSDFQYCYIINLVIIILGSLFWFLIDYILSWWFRRSYDQYVDTAARWTSEPSGYRSP